MQKSKKCGVINFDQIFGENLFLKTKFELSDPSGAPNHQNFGANNMTSARSQNPKLWYPFL